MKLNLILSMILVLLIPACSASLESGMERTPTIDAARLIDTAIAQTLTAAPTNTPVPSETPTTTPTVTPTVTETPLPSPTLAPQILLLRKVCGITNSVDAGRTIILYYGGWGVAGSELAQKWVNNLVVDLTIDGQMIAGVQHGPSTNLPYNCGPTRSDVVFLYYTAIVPGLAPGNHTAVVTYKALVAMSDGFSTLGPGVVDTVTFVIVAR